MPQRDGACYDEAVRAWEASDHLDMLRAETAMFHPTPTRPPAEWSNG